MRPSYLNFAIVLVFLFFYNATIQKQKRFGKFNDKSGSGYEFNLKSDFTFNYKARYTDPAGIRYMDIASGQYYFKNDTIVLDYLDRTLGTMRLRDSVMIRKTPVHRPTELLWADKKIYYTRHKRSREFLSDQFLSQAR